jgi:putative sigma-54 modulation protein
MNWKHNFRQVDVSEPLKQYAEDRFQKLQKHLLKESDWSLFYSKGKQDFAVEVWVKNADSHFKAKAEAPNLYAAVEKVAEKLDRQFMKRKDRLQDHQKHGVSKLEKLNQVNPRLEYDPSSYFHKKPA